jgi:hypothetical protein
MREGGAEVGAIHGCVAGGAREEDVLAFGAVDVDGADAGVVCLADGEDGLHPAEDAGTTTEVGGLEFLVLG